MAGISRGSEWHRWEPHIHAPGTVLENQFPVDGWEQYLTALEAVTPKLRAIGITDYCVTRSYERAKSYKESGRLPDCNLLFPNIELRLNTGTIKGNFVNIHLLVCPGDPNHVAELNRFLAQLVFGAFNDKFACTPSDLIRLGRRADPSKSDDEDALRHGCTQFKVSLDNLIDTHRDIEWAGENILIAVSGNADGTSGVKEAADATLREEIEKAAHAIFASSLKQRDFWLGHGKASINELRERYGGCKPCIWGSDAHDLSRVANPAEDRFCWIKGLPTFDALRQACLDPERAYVAPEPPSWAAPSQIIDEVTISEAPWAKTPKLKLNPGLVAVIGARGSGKTALADIIAAACDSYEPSEERPSFLGRAAEHLAGASVMLEWRSGERTTASLDSPVNWSSEAYPRARYLSQQFVETLCSIEGMPTLIKEIERVIFEAHPSIDRDGAVNFEELLELRAQEYRDTRKREEAALASISEQIGAEIEKTRQIASLKSQIEEKKKLVARYQGDRKNLLPKGPNKTAERLQEIVVAAETVRGYIRYYANQQVAVVGVRNEVQDLRQNRAPDVLRSMQERHQRSGLEDDDWKRFLLTYSGDVDESVTKKATEAQRGMTSWRGTPPTAPVDDSGSYLRDTDKLAKMPLAVLEAEIDRLEKLVAADKETANKLSAVTKRIAEENTALDRLTEKLKDHEGARERADALVADREQGYVRVFEAVVSEELILNELYAPLMERLQVAGGTLAKLSFSVTRVANVRAWATRGENDLFDLRGGPFKGIGSLEREANAMLANAWTTGDAAAVSKAMQAFRDKHQEALLDKAPFPRSDQANYRPWSRRFAQWLYSTDHISIEYGIRYDGIDIRKLSPGTRGFVLVLLYLALDDEDDRPLIIDQPEENLDPKSIYDELVPLFVAAKRKRQVIMVTHNANLVINTDADQIIVAEVGAHTAEGLPPITYSAGGLEEVSVRKIACDILEGGELAFKDRARRLRIAFAR
ncbi:energy-coupling factor transporter ATP-binding protein EcfA2 [Sinorhizobium meliloti]